jgi:hypothetical protein
MRVRLQKVVAHLGMTSGLPDDSIEHLKSLCSALSESAGRESITDLLLDPAARIQGPLSDEDIEKFHASMVSYIRIIFFEIVRVQYWRHISDGKIPRQSFSSKFLLHSIDIALNTCSNGLQTLEGCSEDWFCVEEAINADESLFISVLAFLDSITPEWFTQFRYIAGWAISRKTKRAVYM